MWNACIPSTPRRLHLCTAVWETLTTLQAGEGLGSDSHQATQYDVVVLLQSRRMRNIGVTVKGRHLYSCYIRQNWANKEKRRQNGTVGLLLYEQERSNRRQTFVQGRRGITFFFPFSNFSNLKSDCSKWVGMIGSFVFQRHLTNFICYLTRVMLVTIQSRTFCLLLCCLKT
jgi:hypothetical protein